jgi:CheY-like chemotaxis protein
MDRIWLEAPLPALGVRTAGAGVEVVVNEAARRWARGAGIADTALQAAGAAAWAGRLAAGPLQLGELTVHGVPLPHADGLVLWLQPQPGYDGDGFGSGAASAAGLHVVCVEDNPVNLQLVRELIALRPEVRLRTAIDGLSGVQAVLAEPPDLLLLDLQLPDIDGLEVMRRVRAHSSTAACRIVALSADAMPGHIEAALAAGFDDYWTKPIQFDAFLGHIDRMSAQRRAA